MRDPEGTVLFITQVYPPDPAAVGQQLADVAADLAARGRSVTVLTADRGYDDPAVRYPRRETREGVRIVRLPWSSLGKRSMLLRLAGGLSFIVQATLSELAREGTIEASVVKKATKELGINPERPNPAVS